MGGPATRPALGGQRGLPELQASVGDPVPQRGLAAVRALPLAERPRPRQPPPDPVRGVAGTRGLHLHHGAEEFDVLRQRDVGARQPGPSATVPGVRLLLGRRLVGFRVAQDSRKGFTRKGFTDKERIHGHTRFRSQAAVGHLPQSDRDRIAERVRRYPVPHYGIRGRLRPRSARRRRKSPRGDIRRACHAYPGSPRRHQKACQARPGRSRARDARPECAVKDA